MQHILKKLIQSSPTNKITYEQYINTVLYHEEKGYYMKDQEKVGKKGDFITTSNISTIFGKLFATIFHKLISLENVSPFICEIGGGNGRFAKAVLDELKNSYTDTYQKMTYIMIETSPYHQRLQQEILPIGQKVIQFHSIDAAKKKFQVFNGVLFSNELFDAFPVRVIEKQEDILYEVKITLTKDEQLCEIVEPLTDERILHYLNGNKINLANGQRFEVPLQMLSYLEELSGFLGNSVVFTVDYGYTNEEWMEPARRKGSLRGYYKHHLMNNPLEHPGDMDLTTHIHFDTVISKGKKLGLVFVKKLRQDEFLIAAGILTFLQDNFDPNPFSDKSKQNRAIRSLIMDGGMSAAFHVLIQEKDIKINWETIFQDN
ncbi:SAM-dependent methyltransferase [Bacillus sp. JJ1533]|uniref:class I SAM-dependent methyltransferase n=1 Tax=Bacillus sp. JJ1533 TaxID=3122959 RepID=UPI002FFEC748